MRLLLALLICNFGFAAAINPQPANPSRIRIVPVTPTPEADNVKTTIMFPRAGEIVGGYSIGVGVRLLGFPVGVISQFERKNEIYDDPNGQSLLVFIDDYHPFEIYLSFLDTLEPSNIYYDYFLTQDIPYPLGEGMHVIRAFPARSFGEGLKNPGTFKAQAFYVGSPINNLNVDLNGPYLTYNEPLETLRYIAERPLLLDFYITNTELSQDGYKVRVIINGKVERTLTTWTPYYIYGMGPGRHSLRLQLLDETNTIVPGIFNDVERIITID